MQVICCSNGKKMLEYLEKRGVFILHPQNEKWWVVVDYCPWCGKLLEKDRTEEMESF